MVVRIPPICGSCIHANPVIDGNQPTCRAYPDGIPDDILAGADHRKLRGDEQMRYVHELDTEDEYRRMSFDVWLAPRLESTP